MAAAVSATAGLAYAAHMQTDGPAALPGHPVLDATAGSQQGRCFAGRSRPVRPLAPAAARPPQVTLTVNVTQYGGPRHVEGPPVPHVDFPKWKYLLAIDGSTASYR